VITIGKDHLLPEKYFILIITKHELSDILINKRFISFALLVCL
jgi:hypothetical protein